MRFILSNHHFLTKEVCKKVYSLYKLVVDEQITTNPEVTEAIKFSIKYYDESSLFPSRQVFEQNLSEFSLSKLAESTEEVVHHLSIIIGEVKKRKLQKDLLNLSSEQDSKVVFEKMDSIKRDHFDLEEERKKISCVSNMSLKSIMEKPEFGKTGAITGIRELDNHLGSITPGTTVVLCAGRSMGKSCMIDNFNYINSYQKAFDILHFTLEIPKDFQYIKNISRHSYQMDPQTAIPYKSIKEGLISPEEKERLKIVEDDWKKTMQGSIRYVDISDGLRFDPESFEVFIETEYRIKPFNIITFDYIQLTKYSVSRGYDEKEFMNSIVSVIRRKTVSIGPNHDKIISVILSQANREGIKKADRNQGAYDLNALAEVNELERAGVVIIFLYMDDILRSSGEIKYQLLKNRDGQLICTPQVTFIDAAFAVVGETQAYNEVFDTESLSLIKGSTGDVFGSGGDELVF